jgi:ribosome-associated heat shock protein Hsp15
MGEADRQRIDKWLVYARVVKSRSLASKLVASGHVRVNRARTVKPGDVLTIALVRGVLVWRVLALGDRRGPAVEARALYDDLGAARGAAENMVAAQPED